MNDDSRLDLSDVPRPTGESVDQAFERIYYPFAVESNRQRFRDFEAGWIAAKAQPPAPNTARDAIALLREARWILGHLTCGQAVCLVKEIDAVLAQQQP